MVSVVGDVLDRHFGLLLFYLHALNLSIALFLILNKNIIFMNNPYFENNISHVFHITIILVKYIILTIMTEYYN